MDVHVCADDHADCHSLTRPNMKRSIRHIIATTLATLMVAATFAQIPAKPAAQNEDPLYRRIDALDKAVFDAFNGCDLEKLASHFAPELEFYHDKGGVTWGRDQFISDVKRNVCGKFRRELVAGSLEVWPIGEWGAVYSGTHMFCQLNATRCEGIGKFMHIWQNKAGVWRITRVISFDHRAAPN